MIELEALAQELCRTLGLDQPPPLLGRDLAACVDALRKAHEDGRLAGLEEAAEINRKAAANLWNNPPTQHHSNYVEAAAELIRARAADLRRKE